MKYLSILLLLIILFSCSKEKGSKSLPIFRFKANGTLYDWSGQLREEQGNEGKGAKIVRYYYLGDPTIPAGYKIFAGDFRNNGANRIWVDLLQGADTLKPATYFYRSQERDGKLTELTIGTWGSNDTKGYINGLYQDSVSITITSFNNGFASGTFYGSLTQVGPLTDMQITGGIFENLPVIQK